MRSMAALVVVAALAGSASGEPTAKSLYYEGKNAFDSKDYKTAVQKYLESYRLSQAPLLLYNVGQAYRLEGDCASALVTYQRFVALDPTSEEGGRAFRFIRELEPICAATATTAKAPPDRKAEAARRARTARLVGVATGGGGAVLFATGIAFGHHASVLGNDVTAACMTSCDWTKERSIDAAGHRDSTIGHVLDGLGLAAIAAGAGLYYFGDRRPESHFVVQSDSNGGAVSWWGVW